MKTKLTHRLWAKILAITLLVISCIVIVAGAAGVIICYDNNIYYSSGSFYRSSFCEQEAWSCAYQIEDLVRFGGLDNLQARLDEVYYPSAWICVRSTTGEVLAASSMPVSLKDQPYANDTYYRSDSAFISTVLFDLQGSSYGYYSEAAPDAELVEGYTVTVAVAPALTEGDEFFEAAQFFHFFYGWRYAFWVIAAAAAILALCCLVFLIFAAGHRRGSDEIVLNPIDRVPLDLLTALYFAAFLSAVYVAAQLNAFAMLLVFACIGAPLALSLILTFATRCKIGGVLKNTLIFRIGHWAFRHLRLICRALPLIWKGLLAIVVICCVEAILLLAALSYNAFGQLLFSVFNVLLFFAACFCIWQMHMLKKAGKTLASGNFEHKLDTSHMYWEFRAHGEDLNSIGKGMAIAVEQRMKSERLKTELITNVSHDIKTPLTSIINYVDLLQREDLTDGERKEYLEVLTRQTQRLKKLTEDLVEASKASTGNISVNLVPTNLAELVNQAAAEYSERLAAVGLKPVLHLPDETVYAQADGRLLWRVLDNLLANACKYALPGTRIYLDVCSEADRASLSVKNISRDPLNVSPDELMERFVRGDTSRSTDGSGLGLSIARSLTELQGGSFSLTIDGDLFKAEVCLKR